MGVDDVTDLDHKGNLEGRLDLCAMSHCTSKPFPFQSRGSTPEFTSICISAMEVKMFKNIILISISLCLVTKIKIK